MDTKKTLMLAGVIVIALVVGAGLFICGMLFAPTMNYILSTPTHTPSQTLTPTFTLTPTTSPTGTSTATITPTVTRTPTGTPTATPSPLSLIYLTLNVNEFPTYTIYWNRELWNQAVERKALTEDFALDNKGYGELTFPYLSGKGFLLTGDSTAQILGDSHLLPSGNLIHFRDWGKGLTFHFPNESLVSAFAFDYKASEIWQLTFNDIKVEIPKGTNRFLGVVIHERYPIVFILSSDARVQGGLSVDNISYLPVAPPK